VDTPNPNGSAWRVVSSEWRRRLVGARRRRRSILPVLPLCAALVGVGVVVASLGQTRVLDVPAFEDPAAREDEGGRASRGDGAGPDAGANAGDAARPPSAPAAPAQKLITRDVSVQVLNATRVGRADDRMVRRLRVLGYQVLAVHPAASSYRRTTVFWSRPSGRAAATALAQRFGWRAERRPRNLSPSVTIHVVVGRDAT
jgi:hypothetical protein